MYSSDKYYEQIVGHQFSDILVQCLILPLCGDKTILSILVFNKLRMYNICLEIHMYFSF